MSLPPNFSFVWKSLVAGSAHPGRGPALSGALAALRDQRITAVLSLTEEPLEYAIVREFEMDYLHLPIDDFTAPTPQQVGQAVAFLDGHVAQERAALVHCRAGIGRTGTILACFLVAHGMEPATAIDTLRQIRPTSLEVYPQEYCVYQYAKSLENDSKTEEIE